MSARDATTTTTTTTVVRFSETDGQGVVFNGAYAYYADAALDGWLERTMGRRRALEALERPIRMATGGRAASGSASWITQSMNLPQL